jgi:hypothetical protein
MELIFAFGNLANASKKTKYLYNLKIKLLFADAEKPSNESSEIKFGKECMNANTPNVLLTA